MYLLSHMINWMHTCWIQIYISTDHRTRSSDTSNWKTDISRTLICKSDTSECSNMFNYLHCGLKWLRLLRLRHKRCCHCLSCVLRTHRLKRDDTQGQNSHIHKRWQFHFIFKFLFNPKFWFISMLNWVLCVGSTVFLMMMTCTNLTADGGPPLWCHLNGRHWLAGRCAMVCLQLCLCGYRHTNIHGPVTLLKYV